MAPTLLPGEFLVAVRPAPGLLRAGTLVVVEHPSRAGFEVVKRLDHLTEQAGYWVVGDNLAASTDSRSFGPVGPEDVRGVVVFRYWPPGRFGVPG